MEGKGFFRKFLSAFLAAVLLMTLLLPLLSPVKKNTCGVAFNKFSKSLSNPTSQSQNAGASSLNLMEEEEEEEYTQESTHEIDCQLSYINTISFFSPNLFFNEHFIEVSGPPPWLQIF